MQVSEEEFLFAEVKLGIQLRQFLDTPAGQYLLGRAQDELRQAQDSILTTPPYDVNEITNLQNRAQSARMVMGWLGEALANSDQAEIQLREMENSYE